MAGTTSLTIRRAERGDCALILSLVRELADFEKLSHEVSATTASLEESLFGERVYAEAVIAEEHGQAIGFALFFHNYSTFLGRQGLYLEDLFVRPAARGRGYGKALLAHVAAIAVARACGRFEWSVLDWNQSAIDFYRSVGARPLDDWTVQRLTGAALQALAASAGDQSARR